MNNEHAANTLCKKERLSLKNKINLLYEHGHSFVAFPLRITYLTEPNNGHSGVSLMLCVPKKKIRKAVNRNYIKRQMREAFRVRKHNLIAEMIRREHTLLLSVLYLDKAANPFRNMEIAMDKAMTILLNKV
ncbi:MAG: ribonuclease P protein component [Tannerellaceae bacterium]|jgi:ribonuclease P protein component|nr:ribonuclease P protein component [Tannerellaceae bacterium]